MTLLNVILFVLSAVAWIMIYVVFFKRRILDWLDNRYGKDKPPAVPEDAPPEAVLPFSFDRDHLLNDEKKS